MKFFKRKRKGLIIDHKKMKMDSLHHTAMTTLDNVSDDFLEKNYSKNTYNVMYLQKGIEALRKFALVEKLDDMMLFLPKNAEMPLILASSLDIKEDSPCLMIAPIIEGEEDDKAD
ncbi:MAG: hypothetical protein GTO02_10560 [Candidatus Dadabacteria bacterium]|nr:hypothetical protein [Candidatus Dadabacteria bacterium]